MKTTPFPRGAASKEKLILLDNCEVLSEVRIDDYEFKVTLYPTLDGACILWFKDRRISTAFDALGRFTRFEKRSVLEFIVRYATASDLRDEIEKRRFAARVNQLPLQFLEHIAHLDPRARIKAFESLYDLNGEIEVKDLSQRRRIMAKRFHPDSGGSDKAMSLINEGFDLLSSRLESR